MPSQPRVTWIDTVKGIAIILVVLYHAVDLAAPKAWSGDQLDKLTSALMSVRMPLFFAMSGYFFLRRIDRPWTWQLRNRMGPFLWLFVLWTGVWVLAFEVIPWQRVGGGGGLREFLLMFVDPSIGPWYIYALAIYFVIVKLMRPLPVWLQLAIGAAVSISVGCGFVHVDAWAWQSILTQFIAFQIGVFGNRILAGLAERASVGLFLVVAVPWAALTGILFVTDVGLASPGRIPLTLLGMAMGVIAATLLDRHARWLKLDWFGRNTLPIYLLHVPMLGLIYSLDLGLPANAAVQIGVPLLATVGAVALSLAVWRVFRPVPGLFVAPWTGEGANTREQKQPERQQRPAPRPAGAPPRHAAPPQREGSPGRHRDPAGYNTVNQGEI
jgi:uncharacterized membrane protein YcfT